MRSELAETASASPSRSSRPWIQLAVVTAVVLGCLAPVAGAEFIWDDYRQIVDAAAIRDLASIPGYFTSNVWDSFGEEGSAPQGVEIYRPMFPTMLTLAYALFGGARPAPFHLLSVALHLAVTWMVWLAARRWGGAGATWFPVGAALLFALHPVTAEAVVFVSASCEIVSAGTFLAAALLLDVACRPGSRPAVAWPASAAAGVILLVGLMSKEVMMMAMPAMAIYLVVVRGVAPRYHLGSWLAVVVYLGLRVAVLGGTGATGAGGAQRLEALHHLPLLVADGLRAMVTMTPVGYRELAFEYEGISWGLAVAAAVALVALGALAWVARRTAPAVTLSVAVTVAMLAPVALVSTVPGWGGFGRYLYLPLALTAVAAAQVAVRARAGLRGRLSPAVCVALAIGLCGYVVLQQVGLRAAIRGYATMEQLAREAIVAAPESGAGYMMLGHVLMERQELPQAIALYERALDLSPGLHQARQNLAIALIWTGRPAAGLSQAELLERQGMVTAKSSFAVVLATLELGRVDEAAERLLWSLQQAPDDEDLLWLQEQLLRRHPDPEGYRRWLVERLDDPEMAAAAAAVAPLMDAGESAGGGEAR